MRAYLTHPKRVNQPLPAVLVIQEIWGPDEHIQDVARRFATAGYVAIAPDLYSRGGRPEILSEERVQETKDFLETIPRTAWQNRDELQQELSRIDAAKGQRIQETVGKLFGPRDVDGYCQDLKAWIDYLASSPAGKGKPVGSIGYCMGGALSFALACVEPRLKVAQVYYGTAPSTEQMTGIQCPVYGFYGEKDAHITNAVPEVAASMRQLNKTYEYTIYSGAEHAFFNDARAAYHVDAARDAWSKSLGLFNQYLG